MLSTIESENRGKDTQAAASAVDRFPAPVSRALSHGNLAGKLSSASSVRRNSKLLSRHGPHGPEPLLKACVSLLMSHVPEPRDTVSYTGIQGSEGRHVQAPPTLW